MTRRVSVMANTILDNSHNDGAESRLSIHEVPEQISRIFFGKPEVSKYLHTIFYSLSELNYFRKTHINQAFNKKSSHKCCKIHHILRFSYSVATYRIIGFLGVEV